MKLTLLFDGHTFDMHPQGTSTFLAGLINALPSVATRYFPHVYLEIHCAAKSADNVSKYIKIPFTFHPIRTDFASRNLLGLPLLSRQIKADFVVSQYVRPLWVNKHSATVIHDLLFIDFPSQFSFKYRISRSVLFGLAAKFSNSVFTVSEYSKSRIEKIYGISPERIFILPNAITSAPLKTILHANTLRSAPPIRLLYVSRLEERKRHEWCVRVFEDLRAEGFDVYLTLVGHGSGSYAGKLKSMLQKKIAFYGSRLTHLEGISQEQLYEKYAETDVFLFPSLGEGFGIPVIEAASCGIPCVVTNGSALAELDKFYAGKTFEPENYSQFLSVVKEVLENLDSFKEKAQQNIKKVTEHFSWDATASRFLKTIIALEK